MKKIVLFFGVILVSFGLSAERMVRDFVNAYSLYMQQSASLEKQDEKQDSSKGLTSAYIEFSNFLLMQMKEYGFLIRENIEKYAISDIFKLYLDDLGRGQTEKNIDCRQVYDDMIPGVCFCFKKPEEARSLVAFGCRPN